MSEKIRVVLADDHPLILSGLQARLAGEPDITVVGTATRGDALVATARTAQPDVIVADVRMPGGDLFQVLGDLFAAAPDVRVLVLSASDSQQAVAAALERGVAGFLSKDTEGDAIAGHIRAVASGQTVLDAYAAAAVAAALRAPAKPSLSAREREILELVARGETNAQIGAALVIGASTVKTHLDRIFDKLGVRDRTAAVSVAKDAGLL